MKNIFYTVLSALAVVFLSAGCQKIDSPIVKDLVGEWHYSATECGVEEDIYLSFHENGQFEIYQKVGEGAYWYSTGECSMDKESMVLTGVYSDRYRWKYSYKVSVGGSILTMTAQEDPSYSVTYKRESIPSEVLQMSLPLTKAGADEVQLFL